jgi:hypothetical protein
MPEAGSPPCYRFLPKQFSWRPAITGDVT